MQISSTRVVKEEGSTWVVTDTAKVPMGEAVDTTTVEKGTLVPVKRVIKQGPMTIELAFAGGKATGTMAMGAEPKPVSVDLGGPLFADGNAAHDLARLACRSPRGTRRRSATSTSRSRSPRSSRRR